jgi:hypothetical protein
MQMAASGYISHTEAIVKASWSLFQHDGVAAFKLSERSPLPPALPAMYLHGGQTKILNVRHILRMNHHPVESDKDSAPESISETEDWLNKNADLDNPIDRKVDCAADYDSDIKHNNYIEDLEWPEQQDVSAAPNVLGLVRLTRKSNRYDEKVLVAVNVVEMQRNKGRKKK